MNDPLWGIRSVASSIFDVAFTLATCDVRRIPFRISEWGEEDECAGVVANAITPWGGQ